VNSVDGPVFESFLLHAPSSVVNPANAATHAIRDGENILVMLVLLSELNVSPACAV
jgi:hypothetical protein